MGVYVNRTLNMKQIEAIGFDMDHTLVRYHSEAFEAMTYHEIKKKLCELRKYPSVVQNLKFNIDLAIRGLVIDKPMGNVLKLSTYSKVKKAFHGTQEMDFKAQQKTYQGLTIDLNDSARYSIVDTTFSISYCVLYMQIVALKDKHPELNLPDYKTLNDHILEALDLSHRDGTLKAHVRQNVKKFIMQEPALVKTLEKFKRHGKKLWVITNSDFDYTKLLLDYAINPFLKESKNWQELFNLVVTFSAKPKFFTDRSPLLQVDPATGFMKNHHGKIADGVYQGGNAASLQKDAGLSGEQILYLGDHIFGDVLKIKKTCNWRTALVIEELIPEVEAQKRGANVMKQMNLLMREKVKLESKIDELLDQEVESGKGASRAKAAPVIKRSQQIDDKLKVLIPKYNKLFNEYWGETMRAGLEPSRLAGQIEKYACIYVAKVSDLLDCSPRTYFRPIRKTLPHDLG